jgi:hypothetical protein
MFWGSMQRLPVVGSGEHTPSEYTSAETRSELKVGTLSAK